MLANGATLSYKKEGDSDFVVLPGLKELPDMGTEPEKVENTTLDDEIKQYEMGIGDAGDMAYKFKYDNTKEDSPYRALRALQESGETAEFKETLKDGTETIFSAQVSVKRLGGGVNAALEFSAAMALQSKITYKDPGATAAAAKVNAGELKAMKASK